KKPANAADAKARVDAAIQIGNPGERDEALATACRDAAGVGAGEAVKYGTLKIGNPGTRDEVMVDCAIKLRDAGQGSAATDVAKMIGNPGTRDDVLKKLSSGS